MKKKDKIEKNGSEGMGNQEGSTSSEESLHPTAEGIDELESADLKSASGEDLPTPTDPMEALQAELEKLKVQADEYLEGWQRARAEFSNYKKRIENEREADRIRTTGRILGRYLDIMDDFQRALKDLPSDGESSTWSDGIEMIYRKFQAILESEGIEEIRPEGEQFDPNFHEAISQDDSGEYKEGEIVDVIAPGFKIGERVIRPAMVRVAK